MSRSLLVLGASVHQLDVIRTAKQIGYRVVCIDYIANNPGHMEADASHIHDTTDLDGVLTIAKLENIEGVVSPCTDVAVTTASHVSDKLNLTCNVPIESARIVTSKLKFRDFQKLHSIPHPEYYLLKTDYNIRPSTGKWIVKPDMSSGSKGVYTVHQDDELSKYASLSQTFSLNDNVVVERVIEGHHGTIEGVIHNGNIVTTYFMDRGTDVPPNICTSSHKVPTNLTKEAQAKVISQLNFIWKELKIDNTVFDADFIWTGCEAIIIETSPRLGGNSITQLVKNAYNYDFSRTSIDLAFDMPPRKSNTNTNNLQHHAVVLIGLEHGGYLNIDNDVLKSLNNNEWLSSIRIHATAGTKVSPFVNGRGCVVTAFISANTRQQLDERELLVRNSGLVYACH